MSNWNRHNIEAEVKRAVAAGKFQKNTAQIEQIILGAAKIFLAKSLPENLDGEIDSAGLPDLPRAKLKVGHPEQSALRYVVFSSLFRAWMLGKGLYPTINNKDHRASPFMIFVEPILEGLGIGKAQAHLEEFRSYRKRALIDSGFEVVRGKVN